MPSVNPSAYCRASYCVVNSISLKVHFYIWSNSIVCGGLSVYDKLYYGKMCRAIELKMCTYLYIIHMLWVGIENIHRIWYLP